MGKIFALGPHNVCVCPCLKQQSNLLQWYMERGCLNESSPLTIAVLLPIQGTKNKGKPFSQCGRRKLLCIIVKFDRTYPSRTCCSLSMGQRQNQLMNGFIFCIFFVLYDYFKAFILIWFDCKCFKLFRPSDSNITCVA